MLFSVKFHVAKREVRMLLSVVFAYVDLAVREERFREKKGAIA